eukprot:6213364-Pleurochrysis_carterae.AAC.1
MCEEHPLTVFPRICRCSSYCDWRSASVWATVFLFAQFIALAPRKSAYSKSPRKRANICLHRRARSLPHPTHLNPLNSFLNLRRFALSLRRATHTLHLDRPTS